MVSPWSRCQWKPNNGVGCLKVFATIDQVEEKTRRDRKYFSIKNGRNKRIKFAKPFVSAPQIHAQAVNSSGTTEVAEVVSVTVKKARIRFSTKDTWIGTWEATPYEDLVV